MTMIRRYVLTVLLILICEVSSWRLKHKCPIGFHTAYPKSKPGDDPICYKIKGPEKFKDKFLDCAGNLFTVKLLQKLNVTQTDLVVWTDYKTQYLGGRFYDWSYSDSTGEILEAGSDVKIDSDLLDNEICLVIDPVTSLTTAKCDDRHYRYCFIKPYVDEDDMSDDGCEGDGYKRFWSPRPACLQAVKGVGGGAVRARWTMAKELCKKRGGSLLNKGWRYANHPMFSISVAEPTFPLGIVLSPDNTTVKYDTLSNDDVIPNSDWHFENSSISNDTSYGALHDDFWYLVNGSYVFFDVICERPVRLKSLIMNFTYSPTGNLVLKLNDTGDISEKDIVCLTDSMTFYPKRVKVKYDDGQNYYNIKNLAEGNYWCAHKNTKKYFPAETNKVFYVRDKESLINNYAIKIKFPNNHNLNTTSFEERVDSWRKNLEEYIYYWNKYVKVFGDDQLADPLTAETTLKEFKASHPDLKVKEGKVIRKTMIKRYVEGGSALLHVELEPDMMAVGPGTWGDLEVKSMKPVYYCRGVEGVPMLPLGASTTAANCRTYTCVGSFIEGVQWVTTAASGCIRSTTAVLRTDVNVDLMPTVVPASEDTLDLPMPTVILPEKAPGHGIPIKDESDSESNETPADPGENNGGESVTLMTLVPPISYTVQNTESPSTEITSTESTSTETTHREVVSTVNYYPTESISTETTYTEVVSTVNYYHTESYSPEIPIVVPTINFTTALPPTTPTTTMPPEEQLQNVIEQLEFLLENDTITITVENIGTTFDQVDELLHTHVQIPGRVLQLIDEIGSKVDLEGSNVGKTIRGNIALLMVDSAPTAPVRGFKLAARDDDAFTDDAFEIISDAFSDTHLSNDSEAVVHLPESIAASTRRISFVVFRNDRAFSPDEDHYAVNSKVLSINVENLTHFENGEVIDIHFSPLLHEPERNASRACAYWHFNEDGTGYWSQEGCTFIKSNTDGVLDTCRCDHLTHFAEVLVPRAVFSIKNEEILEILTIIGCCLSMFGLCMVGVTAAMFRSWRRDYSNKIWLQLCVAIFLMVLVFLIIVLTRLDNEIFCIFLGVVLHYVVLASFCWMLVAAILSYRRLVIVFSRDASHKLLRASAFAWGVPCIIVGILLSADPHSYAGRFEEKTPSGDFCYPSGLGLWLAVYAPIAVMLIANWSLFILIVRSVFASRRIQRHGDSNEALRCASVSCLLVFLFGLPWVFGLFASNIVAAYLFTLTATFQGFVLFIFFVLGNKKTRDLWLNQLKIKQTRKIPVTTSTYTHRSVRGEMDGVAAAERNSSKPKSLAYPDNARFS